ncbi:hypothetical protein [Rufibacter ruber]|nr:hypothetical protein [Rufibacter ruber]
MYKPFRALFLFSCLVAGSQVQAQQISNSPYSRFGVGDILHGTGNVRSQGMGQVGVASPSYGLINDQNPALLYYNRRVIFDVSVSSDLKRLSDGENTQVDGEANFNSLSLAIPVSNRWTASLGLKPYSRVNYYTFVRQPVPGAPDLINDGEPDVSAYNEYRGSGGINEVHFSNGVRIGKGLTLGLAGSYLFGTIDREAATTVVDKADSVNIPRKAVVHTSTKYTGVMLSGGAHYLKQLSPKLVLGVGAKYAAQATLGADREVALESRLLDETVIGRVVTDSTEGHTSLPQMMQLGFSLDNNKNWVATSDFTYTKGSDFRGFSQDKGAGRAELGDGFKIGVGGEITPDAGSMSSFFKRVTYRVGGYYRSAEIMTDGGGQDLSDVGLTWGFSIPMGRGVRPPDYTQALLNTGFAIGMQEVKGTGIKEEYFKVSLGISFSNQWFIKRRFD